MAIAKLEKHQVIGALKATGSSDADILFARKEELLADTRRMNLYCVVSIAAGAAMCLTLLGAIAGIPAIVYGVRLRKQIRSNIDIAESAYSEYVTALSTRPRAAISTKGSPMHKPTLFVSLALIALSLHAQQPAATPSVCATQRFCAEVNSFAATITDFRTSNVGRYKVVTAAIRFQNKLTRPVVLGYVNGSGVTTDDQGNRYAVSGADGVRGIGLISNNQVDPKFSLQPGASGDTRIEMVWGWSGREVFGLNFEMEFTVREMGQLPSGQFRLGPEHPLRFRGLANNILSTAPAAPQGSAAPLSESLGDGPVLPAVTPAPSGGATPSGRVPANAGPHGPTSALASATASMRAPSPPTFRTSRPASTAAATTFFATTCASETPPRNN